mgnify:CR=1 FL=1
MISKLLNNKKRLNSNNYKHIVITQDIDKNIKINVLEDKKMREIGFTDFRKDTWYFSRMLKKEISFSLSVNKENPADFRIDVLDDDFCQPYDYQSIL